MDNLIIRMEQIIMDHIKKIITQGRQSLGQPLTNNPLLTPTPAKSSNPLELGADVPLCPECHTPADVGLFKMDVPPGHEQFGKLIKCDNEFHAETRLKRMAAISQLGPEDIKRRLSDITRSPGNEKMLDAAQDILERGYGWLYIFGGPGNAKSEVLKAIVNQMNETGKGPAIYTTLSNILDYIRAGYGAGDYPARFETLKTCPVLAVDEMDKIKDSDWVNEFRFKFLDARYMSAVNKLSMTIYAGQPHPKVIYDDVIFDRFRDGRFQIIENHAPSARPQMRWNK